MASSGWRASASRRTSAYGQDAGDAASGLQRRLLGGDDRAADPRPQLADEVARFGMEDAGLHDRQLRASLGRQARAGRDEHLPAAAAGVVGDASSPGVHDRVDDLRDPW
ncbi:hypothetical protein [Streptomyces botrytidirepellens]|uniref:hypothetical protein n=1 Tax=Streptomyces botrytidirepellens TaxID=2486417 RepID=UPI001FE92422|nr:hypothetical protein [Streptomyces botrytidirepellens]